MFTVGTGIGGGLVLGGRVYRGATGAAGELGHTLIGADLAAGAPRRVASPSPDRSSRWPPDASWTGSRRRSRPTILPRRSASCAASGDPDRRTRCGRGGARPAIPSRSTLLRMLGERLGVGIANAINTFDPDVVAIGGGVSTAGDLLLGPATEAARRYILPGVGERTEIRLARHGERGRGAGGRAARPARARGSEAVPAATVPARTRHERRAGGEPLRAGRRGAPSRADDAGDLRRDRGPGGEKASSGDLQPRARRPAAGALRGDRDRQAGGRQRGVSSPCPRGDRGPLADRDRGGRLAGARAAGSTSCTATSTTRSCSRPSSPGSRRRMAMSPAQRVFYLAVSASFFGADRQGARGGGLGAGADPPTRLMIEKPFGHDLASALELDRRHLVGLRRVAGIPHRPLPRQGDGPEPPGAAVRATASSSRSGTAATSTTSRSPWPRTSGSAAAPATTTRPARFATWSRTT